MAAAGLEFLEFDLSRQVDRPGVVRGAGAVEEGDDVNVGVAEASDLEDIAVDVVDAKAVWPRPDHAGDAAPHGSA